ncbi:MAG: hypothetical protein ACLR7Z_15390 [Bilophila wadsworthia]
MNAPWSRLFIWRRATPTRNATLVLAGDAMFDFYYLAKGRLRIMHGAENGRERAMVYIGSGNIHEATAPADSTIPTAASTVWKTCTASRHKLDDPRFVAEYPELIINLISMSTAAVMHNLSETGGGTQ